MIQCHRRSHHNTLLGGAADTRGMSAGRMHCGQRQDDSSRRDSALLFLSLLFAFFTGKHDEAGLEPSFEPWT